VIALPPLAPTVGAPPEAVAELAAKGHTVVRGLASRDEVEAFRPAIEAAATARAWNRDIPPEERDTYTKAFLQAINLWRVDETIARFVLAPRFGRVAAELLGVDGVRLYHDQARFKEPHGGHTPWHQDQYYWPLEGPCAVTMWMPLVDVPPEVGSMTFASGSHLRGDLRGPAISDASEEAFARAVDDLGLPCETHGALAAGDATFHAGWTLHRAGPNPTDRMRPVMTVIYVADGARVAPAIRPEQELDHRFYLPGTKPGDLAATGRNPLIWTRTGFGSMPAG
jgi:ectoine hydroxylase-related dioxygenase (phytanoyl-CoA dioxygenase family)